jgi:hypothetical protein
VEYFAKKEIAKGDQKHDVSYLNEVYSFS